MLLEGIYVKKQVLFVVLKQGPFLHKFLKLFQDLIVPFLPQFFDSLGFLTKRKHTSSNLGIATLYLLLSLYEWKSNTR